MDGNRRPHWREAFPTPIIAPRSSSGLLSGVPLNNLEGRLIAQRFRIEQRLGAGGMGEVFRATDEQLRRPVALKRLPATRAGGAADRAALLREARNSARITHSNVAGVYDVVEDGDDLFLVMEFVAGQTLRARLGALSVAELFAVALQCAEGLAAAHRQGVVHGDIKPENVMLTGAGEAKILDFGIARLFREASSEATTATTAVQLGALSGTLPYMAPEALTSSRVDHRADLFSLGVVIYELAAGVHPFVAETPVATIDRILHQAPAPLARLAPGVPAALERIVDKLLAKTPAERYATTEDLCVDLRNARARLTAPVTAWQPPRKRLPTPWFVALAATAAAAALLLYLAAGRPDEAEAPAGSAAFDAADWVIAVLPGAPGEDAEVTALASGLAATLTSKLTQLSRSHGLQVIPASSLRERQVDGIDRARKELGVTLAIDFQIHRAAGDTVRVNLNLVDTRVARQVDADTFDGQLADAIDLEERVATRALRMLRVELRPLEQDIVSAGTQQQRAHGYYLQGKGYLEARRGADDIAAAITLFEQSLRADPSYARAHAGLGTALWEMYRIDNDARGAERALEECRLAVDLDDLEPAGHTCLGIVLDGSGRSDEAVAALLLAREVDPSDDQVVLALARAYGSLGRDAEAEATFAEAIAQRPFYWAGYSWLGSFYLGAGRNAEAIENFERAAALAPDSYRSFSNLGVAHFAVEDWQAARQAFERSLAIEPDYRTALSNLGTLYFFEGDYERSASMLERATRLEDGSYTRWGNLADAYQQLAGRREEAEAAYRRAVALASERLQVNPGDGLAHAALARYQVMLGDAEAALGHLQSAMAFAPEAPEVHYEAAVVYLRLGESQRAASELQAALAAGLSRREALADPFLGDLRRALD